MIQALQKFSQSRPAKIFLAIVALSFLTFFGGSSWFRPHDPYAVVAEVGNLSVGRQEFAEKVQRQAQQIQAETGQTLTREDLLKEGLPQMVLGQIVQEILLNLETKHLGLAVSDEAVRGRIHAVKTFHNPEGIFDRALFQQILRANGLSEDSFIAEVRQELIREQLIGAIVVGAFVPEDLATRLFDAQYQHRQASLLMISPQKMPVLERPSDNVLEGFYKEHAKEFKTPELRTMIVLVIDPSLIAKEIPVTEEEIQATYEAKPEAFGGGDGKQPLAKVKKQVIEDVRREKAAEEVYKMTQALEDKIAGGATFEELASGIKGAQIIKLEKVDQKGQDAMGVLSPNLPKNEELTQDILTTAFGLDETTESPFTQTKGGIYYTLRVDKTSPAALHPFAKIKERVAKIWMEMEQLKAAYAKAEGYVNAFNNGDRKVSLMTLLPNLSLSEPSESVSREVKSLVFSLRPERAGMVQTPEGFAVVVLNKILPPEEKVKEEKMDSFKEILLKHYQNDLLMAYLNALHVRYPVKFNSKAIQALFAAGS